MLHKASVFFLSYVANLAGLLLVQVFLDVSPVVKVLAFLIVGFGIGFGLGQSLFFRKERNVVCAASLLSVLTLWTPLVLATYGMALLAVPLLATYSLALLLGWRQASHLTSAS